MLAVERETGERLLEITIPRIPSHLPSQKNDLHPPLPSEPEADLCKSLSNTSRTIENIGFSSESGFQNGPAAAPANAAPSREDVFFPNLPELCFASGGYFDGYSRTNRYLPAFAPDDLFPLPEQPAKEEVHRCGRHSASFRVRITACYASAVPSVAPAPPAPPFWIPIPWHQHRRMCAPVSQPPFWARFYTGPARRLGSQFPDARRKAWKRAARAVPFRRRMFWGKS